MPINYVTAKIYCIRQSNDNDKIVYVGSTVRPLSERMAEHRKRANKEPTLCIHKHMIAVGILHFHIELLLDYPCERNEQLLAKEGEYIRLHNTVNAGLNTYVAGRKIKESGKIYYENNKEAVKEQHRQYYERTKNDRIPLTKEEMTAKNKAYYLANRDRIIARQKAYEIRKRAEKEATAAAIPQQ